MPRKYTILQSAYPYHVYGRCINRQWFDLPIDLVWKIFEDYLYLTRFGFNAHIREFVLMNNHYHLLIDTPEANLDKIMHHLLRETSREISFLAGRINQTFGGPYKWSVLRTDAQFRNVYKYVYRNPIEAGLVRRCEDYRYSTLRGLLGFERLVIPVEDNMLLENGISVGVLDWLNCGTREDFEVVKRALRNRIFKFPVSQSTGRALRSNDFVF